MTILESVVKGIPMPDKRSPKIRLVWIYACSITLLMPMSVQSQAPAGMVYVSNGTTASQVRQDEAPACDHWEIWLFRYGVSVPANGAVSSSPDHWGTIDGSSEQDVEEKLKKEQAFDKAWAASIGPSYNPANDLNAENPMGPVCVTKMSEAAVQQRRNGAIPTSVLMSALEDAAFAAWQVQPNANEELLAYMKNLDAMVQAQGSMFLLLDKAIVPASGLMAFDKQLSQLSSHAAVAKQSAGTLPGQSSATGSAPATAAMAWSPQQHYAGGIVQADQSWSADSDGQGFSVNSTVIKGYPFNQTQQIQMDIRFANIKLVEPPQPGYNATGWGSITVVLNSPLTSTDTVDNSSVFLYFSTQADALAAYRYLLQAEPQH